MSTTTPVSCNKPHKNKKELPRRRLGYLTVLDHKFSRRFSSFSVLTFDPTKMKSTMMLLQDCPTIDALIIQTEAGKSLIAMTSLVVLSLLCMALAKDVLSNEGMSQNLSSFDPALQALDASASREHFQAMKLVPTLVERETPMIYYLRAFDYDTQKAAERLARYWHLRKVAFEGRWLLPMTLTGRGALNELESELVKNGICFVVPRRNKGPLLLVDHTKGAEQMIAARNMGVNTVQSMERIGMCVSTLFMGELCKGPNVLMHGITSNARPALEVQKRFWDTFHQSYPATLTETIVKHA